MFKSAAVLRLKLASCSAFDIFRKVTDRAATQKPMPDLWQISPNDRMEAVQELINKFQQKHGCKGGATRCATENL